MNGESEGSGGRCPQHELISSLFGQFYDLADKRREEICRTIRRENESFRALSDRVNGLRKEAYGLLPKAGQKALMDYESATNEMHGLEAAEIYIQGLKDGFALTALLSESKEAVAALLAATRGGFVQDN
jgi:hypothetical protein